MDVFYSLHAQKQIAERDVDRSEVEAVVRAPEVTYRGKPSKHGPSRIYQRGNLAVAVAVETDGNVLVITVLWRHEDQWTDTEMKENRR